MTTQTQPKLDISRISDKEAYIKRIQDLREIVRLSPNQETLILSKGIKYKVAEAEQHLKKFMETGKDDIGEFELQIAKETIAYDQQEASSNPS